MLLFTSQISKLKINHYKFVFKNLIPSTFFAPLISTQFDFRILADAPSFDMLYEYNSNLNYHTHVQNEKGCVPVNRRKRDWRSGMYYHITMRGNNRMHVYYDDQDKYHLLRFITDAHSKYPLSIVAYCIMSNHFHILMKTEEDLSVIMRLINRRYSDYYSKRYNHIGRIYQCRYFAKLVETPTTLLVMSRYIHRNPIETTIPLVTNVSDYLYSSFPMYTGDNPQLPDYIDTEVLPLYLPAEFQKNAEGYVAYCLKEF